MIPTVSVDKDRLNKLPDAVLRLIGMGQYTLYQVGVDEQPLICYVLRAGEREVFFLQQDGEPVDCDPLLEFSIRGRVVINDVSFTPVIPNLRRF
jgi:hypothetical protein